MEVAINNPKKKKIILFLIPVVVLAAAVLIFLPPMRIIRFVSQSHYKESEVAKFFSNVTSSCNGTGEKFFYHGAGNVCEKKAWDAGLLCAYDEDCAKKCIYASNGAKSGKCEEYFGTEDGKDTCHRPLKNLFPPQGEIICETNIS
jgi:hypothetical protein